MGEVMDVFGLSVAVVVGWLRGFVHESIGDFFQSLDGLVFGGEFFFELHALG